MNTGMKILRPKLIKTGVEPIGEAVLGTVRGDLHDIGKNLFKMMLEGVEFEVLDLRANVSTEDFVSAVKEVKPSIIGLSALLTTVCPKWRTLLLPCRKKASGTITYISILNGFVCLVVIINIYSRKIAGRIIIKRYKYMQSSNHRSF